MFKQVLVLVGKSESPDSMSKAVDIVDVTSKKIQLSPKKMSPPKPWISPTFAKKDSKDLRHRSLSVDHANPTTKTGRRPHLPRQKRTDTFAMDEDGDVSTASTSDSEVVVVLQTKARSSSPRKLKAQNGMKNNKGLSQDEEEVKDFIQLRN